MTVTEIKKSFKGHRSKFDRVTQRVNDCSDKSVEISKTETQAKKREKNRNGSLKTHPCSIELPTSGTKSKDLKHSYLESQMERKKRVG